jgi:DNA-binding transcriptional LysR family regulator
MQTPIPHQLLNTAGIRYFYEVARAHSFRKAGDRIHVAASAINRHVRLLEEGLGAKLFERGRGRSGVELTAAGEVLMRRVSYALNELVTAGAEINALRGQQRVRVSAAVTDAVARDFLPAFFPSFMEANPNIQFNIKVASTPQLIEMLIEDRIEVLLAYDVPPQITIRSHAEYALGSSIAVCKTHPLASRTSVRLAECARFPLALSDEAQYLRGILTRMLGDTGVMPSPLLTTNSYQLMRDVVRYSLAVSVQTRIDMRASSDSDDLVFVPLRDPLARYSILTCASRSGRRLSSAADQFVRAVVASLDQSLNADGRVSSTNRAPRNASEPRTQQD